MRATALHIRGIQAKRRRCSASFRESWSIFYFSDNTIRPVAQCNISSATCLAIFRISFAGLPPSWTFLFVLLVNANEISCRWQSKLLPSKIPLRLQYFLCFSAKIALQVAKNIIASCNFAFTAKPTKSMHWRNNRQARATTTARVASRLSRATIANVASKHVQLLT